MKLLKEALAILKILGLPKQQWNDRSAYTLMSLAALTKRSKWQDTKTPLLRIVDIMDWMRDKFDKRYAPNSRETIRRQTIHQFEQARIVDRNPDDPRRPTNSGLTVYRLTEDVARVLRSYGTDRFMGEIDSFLAAHSSLSELYESQREKNKVPIQWGKEFVLFLSPGEHNNLQRLIIEEFTPRFIENPIVAYLGDTAKKHAYIDMNLLNSLNIPITEHDKLPDVIIYSPSKNWLFLVEAVTSHGPISPKRHQELEKLLDRCTCGRVYVTAFMTADDFRKHAADIVWESEVWIAKSPTHMIHYNGDKFLGPR